MCSLQLECPLCCNETFTCYDDLKDHLINLSNNLVCKMCGLHFEKLLDFAEHLGNPCKSIDYGLHLEDATGSRLKIEEISNIDKSFKENLEERTTVNENALVKALLKSPVENIENSLLLDSEGTEVFNDFISNDNEMETEDDLYHCSTCNINFTSVEDHLKMFHQGHEVFIEATDSNEGTRQFVSINANDDPLFVDEAVLGLDNQESDVESKLQCTAIPKKGKRGLQVLNTVQQEDCVDKDGRLYTRKVVKIEKFWDQNEISETERGPPIPKELYIVSDGILKDSAEVNLQKLINKELKFVTVYQCPKCPLYFYTVKDYENHKCEIKGSKSYKCSFCNEYFVSSKSLCAHMKVHKDEKPLNDFEQTGPFICDVCNTEFLTFKSLRLHIRMHEPVKSKEIEAPVSYGICGEEYSSNDGPREMFTCDICNKSYDKEYEQVHRHSHNSKDNFNCETCNRKFFTRENLEMHMRVHINGKKFTCSYCKKAFLTYENLQDHVNNQCQKRQYECQFCGRRFARPHEKVKHERIHTGEKPHVCQICGKAFRVSYCLTLHMRTHSGTRPYQCPHCGKRFKAHSVYNHHLLTHSDERKYKCPYCPKAFKTGVQLAGHKNSHIKPFTCTECNRPFASLYAVRSHMETHQRQNNLKYSCWVCGASYARAFALRDHIKEQHESEEKVEMKIFQSEAFSINQEEEEEGIVSEKLNAADEKDILMDINYQNECSVDIEEKQ